MSHKVENGSHGAHHNHLNGEKSVDTTGFSNVVSVRKDNLKKWEDMGYEVISDSGDSCLVGKKKESSEP